MTEPPRRLPRTAAQKIEMAIERSAGGSAAADSRYSGPVTQGGPSRGELATIPPGGTTGQGLVKLSGDDYDTDWGSAGGGIIGTASFEAPSPAMGWQSFSATPTTHGDGSWASYDSGSGGVTVTADGYYQAFAWTEILYLNLNIAGVLKLSLPGLGFLQAFAYGVTAGAVTITGPVRWQSAGDLFEVNTSTVGTPGSPAPTTDIAVLSLTRFG